MGYSSITFAGMLEFCLGFMETFGESVAAGSFKVEFIRANHSIADSAAFAIHTPAGVVVHSGDFKINFTPIQGETIDLQRLGELGKKGVKLFLCESTNVLYKGYTVWLVNKESIIF